MRHVVILIASLFSAAAFGAQPLLLPKHTPVPGGIAVIALDTASAARPTAHYQSKRVMVLGDAGHWRAIVGIPLETSPGEQTLEISGPNGTTQQVAFAVQAKEYETQHLNITNKRMVEPTAKCPHSSPTATCRRTGASRWR